MPYHCRTIKKQLLGPTPPSDEGRRRAKHPVTIISPNRPGVLAATPSNRRSCTIAVPLRISSWGACPHRTKPCDGAVPLRHLRRERFIFLNDLKKLSAPPPKAPLKCPFLLCFNAICVSNLAHSDRVPGRESRRVRAWIGPSKTATPIPDKT